MIGYTFKSIGTTFVKMQRKPFQAIGTVLLLSVLFFVVLILLMTASFTAQSVHVAGKKVQITLFLNPSIEDTQLALLKAKMLKMEKDGEILSFSYTSSEKNISQFASENPDTFDFIKQNLPNELTISSSFKITPGTKSIESLLQYFLTGEFKSVIDTQKLAKASVSLQQGKRMLEFLYFLKYGIFGVIGVVILSTIIVISWFIAASFAMRQKEIFIMRLVGGSTWFIRIPFIVESLVMAFVGVLFGWVLFFILRFEALTRLMGIFSTRIEAIAMAKILNEMWSEFLLLLPYVGGGIFAFVLLTSLLMMEYLLRKRDILE